IFNISGKVMKKGDGIFYEVKSSRDKNNIRYTLNGESPTENSLIYSTPLPIDKSMTIKSAYFENGELKSGVTSHCFTLSKSTGKNITLKEEPAPNYSSNGALTLVDGILGNP